jgi:hypothetical protein
MTIKRLNLLLGIQEAKQQSLTDEALMHMLYAGKIAALRMEIATEAIKGEFNPGTSVTDHTGTKFYCRNNEVEIVATYSWRLK